MLTNNHEELASFEKQGLLESGKIQVGGVVAVLCCDCSVQLLTPFNVVVTVTTTFKGVSNWTLPSPYS